jgi:hypothetical protein
MEFIEAKIAEIRERKEEIEPLVQEYNRLEAALIALGEPVQKPQAQRGRPKGSKNRTTQAAATS